MAQFGWMLFLERPKNLAQTLMSNKDMRNYFAPGFAQVQQLMQGTSLAFASKQELFGSACITGQEEDCLYLKEKVEAMQLAKMFPNTDCLRGASE